MKKFILAAAAFVAITSAASASQAVTPNGATDKSTVLEWCNPYEGK